MHRVNPHVNRGVLCCAFLAATVLSRECLAWNKAGHMVSGAIAYNVLNKTTEGREVIEKVVKILEKVPDEKGLWKRLLAALPEDATGDDRKRYMFMLAARWPDDIRGTPRDRPTWHYVNRPFRVEGSPTEGDNKVDKENIETALKKNIEQLKDPTGDAEKRAISACWIFHLVGDAHQPLHTAKLLDDGDFEAPKGDRGGTWFYVRVKDGSVPISLHKMWDGAITRVEKYNNTSQWAIELLQKDKLKPENLPEHNEKLHEVWLDESFEAAKEIAYEEGDLEGSKERNDAPALPAGYVAKMKKTAERRMVLAGYRLAETLREAVK